jgi:hypothetical protein
MRNHHSRQCELEPTDTAERQQDREGHEFYSCQIEFASHVVRDRRELWVDSKASPN